MRQTARIISTCSADTFGVCSALFELGGMIIMHDASGCNSTYTTHDEPRWYDMDSMVYISGLSEMEAIMGDDSKLVDDIVDAARDLKPDFIAVAGTPIPAMTGFDFDSIAYMIEAETGIPSFGFGTTGMNTYVHGASMALEAYARRFVDQKAEKTEHLSVNILGLTPLDFSVNGTDHSVEERLKEAGFEVISKWAMGNSKEDLINAGKAHVNLVLSGTGLGVAKVLNEMFGTPYVIGVPYGDTYGKMLIDELKAAAGQETKDVIVGQDTAEAEDTDEATVQNANVAAKAQEEKRNETKQTVAIVGEGVTSLSLAKAIECETGAQTKVICVTECGKNILRGGDCLASCEEDVENALKDADIMIADPLYKPICPKNVKFKALPTEAFSGRIYRKEILNLVENLSNFIKELMA